MIKLDPLHLNLPHSLPLHLGGWEGEVEGGWEWVRDVGGRGGVSGRRVGGGSEGGWVEWRVYTLA